MGLVLIPGPGTNPKDYQLGQEPIVLDGAIDFRGHEIQKLNEDQARWRAGGSPIWD